MKFYGLSAEGIILRIYQQAGKGFIYFITLRTISQGELTYIVPAYQVCGFFRLSRYGIVNQPEVFNYPSMAPL